MRKLTSILFLIVILSCTNSDNKERINYQNIEIISAEICDCFEKNNGNEDEIMKCFELQKKYSNTIEDSLDKVEFINKTYKCIN